ncbi:MAG: hypothetical protein AAFR38_13320 [Planctomycetota bacterium]
MFASDRDLLVLEPSLFTRVAWVGQRLVRGTGAVTGTTLAATEQDVGFEDAGVTPGMVVLAGGVPMEVIAVTAQSTLEVSRVRADPSSPARRPPPQTGAAFEIATFGPQLADVHRRLLTMVGMEGADEPSIVNAGELWRLEALGALHLIWAGASASGGEHAREAERAEWYRLRFDQERRRARAEIDTDADGVADAARSFSSVAMVRA